MKDGKSKVGDGVIQSSIKEVFISFNGVELLIVVGQTCN